MTRAMIAQQMVTIITQTRTAKCKVHAMIARSITDWINDDLQGRNMNELYYMQFSNAVLETMKTAKEALTEEEYKLFIESVQRLCEQGIRVNDLTKHRQTK